MNLKRAGIFAILALFLTPQAAFAALTITLSDDGFGGVLASFEGSGIALENSESSSYQNLGDYTTLPDLTVFDLLAPVEIASGIFITSMTLDDDSGQFNPSDDFTIFLSQTITAGTPYLVSGSSSVAGLSFDVLNPGVYTPAFGVSAFADLTLVVVPIPAALWLLLSAVGLLGFMRQKAVR